MANISKSYLRSKYIMGFSILGVILLFELLLRSFQYQEQNKYGALINISGRQRMLSQRTLLLANNYVKYEREDVLKKLKGALNEFESNHYILKNGDAKRGVKTLSEHLIFDIYHNPTTTLDKDFKHYVKLLNEIVSVDVSIAQKEDILKELNESSYDLLLKLDYAVKQIEKVSEEKLSTARSLDVFLFIFTILSILFLMQFVFRPMAKVILRTFEHIRSQEQILKDKNFEITKALKIKEDFLANLSHEIRTPLNGIIGMTYDSDKDANVHKIESRLNLIRLCAETLLSLFEDAIEAKALDQGEKELNKKKFALIDDLTAVKEMIEIKAKEKSLHVELVCHSSISKYVIGDKERLNQVLVYLLSNAVKFTKVGHITIEVNQIQPNQYEFFIKDTGIGIEESQLKEIFNEFHQVDNSSTREFGGMGIGLTLAERMVVFLGGKGINVKSKVNVGSTFYFAIPMESVESEEIENEVALDDEIRILLVEDNELNQRLTKIYLQKIDLTCDIAVNGQEALDMMEKQHYNLVLMDIQMPVMDGVTATQKIISKYGENRPKIIALTANVLDEDRKTYSKVGMDGFISKPIQVKVFQDVILSVLQEN